MPSPYSRRPAQRGLTLIELMVAMVLGLLVAAGIVTVFVSTSTSNKAQNQLARLQEEGRFASPAWRRPAHGQRSVLHQYRRHRQAHFRAAPSSISLRAPKVYAET